MDTMRRNDHIQALVRLAALKTANGDMARAEELLAWAYGQIASTPAKTKRTQDEVRPITTDEFIARYLNPYVIPTRHDIALFIRGFVKYEADMDYGKIKAHIRNMPYQHFLQTTYWISIATCIKRAARKKCERCGNENTELHIHHKTYENHGDELHHLDDLVCLCGKCHAETHGIKAG